ncbi:pto-interacting protein 1-like [Salvia miltiorrhiza]|uniref:pto-interacting protein 1-like n=1 Tax=Salvia miltiorrhiza TaxID=226208 RepID=UPI0025AB62C4|nr:pto-interacting protein 1-like [Salvia miltiorrhiza]
MRMWALDKIQNGKAEQIVASNLKGDISEDCLKTFVGVAKRCLHRQPKKRLTMTGAVAQLELALEQQERKGMTTHKSQLWPFWNRVIPSASTQKDEINEVEDEMQPIAPPSLRVNHTVNMVPIYVPSIPLAEIMDITDDFSRNSFISNGYRGRGSVFHGVLKSGQGAAIKRFYLLREHELIAQISTVSRLKHENVVKLVGYCLDTGLKVLVYEFAPRGSLHDILHGRRQGMKGLELESCPALSWSQRIKIAVGVARGLSYIHENALIHHKIRSNKVLLFADETAKITDLYLSTQCSYCRTVPFMEDRHPSVLSIGYEHPEQSKHTQKSDVYCFGVILLELLTGCKPVDVDHTQRARRRHIVPWAKPQLFPEKIHNIVDARLKSDYPPNAVERMAAVAALCLQDEPDFRPDMSIVVRTLQSIPVEPNHN